MRISERNKEIKKKKKKRKQRERNKKERQKALLNNEIHDTNNNLKK